MNEKLAQNYNQLSEDHSLMESEIANLQFNFKECNQSIETLTNRLQSNYEDLTRFINKGIKGGGTSNSNATINQDIEEEMHRMKNDLKNVMNNVKDMKRLLKEGNGATMTSSKTPSNEYMQSGYNNSIQHLRGNDSQAGNVYRGGVNTHYEEGAEKGESAEHNQKIQKLISNENVE